MWKIFKLSDCVDHDGKMWLALTNGEVVSGIYEWRQGRNPDYFITDQGPIVPSEISYWKPFITPMHPDGVKHILSGGKD